MRLSPGGESVLFLPMSKYCQLVMGPAGSGKSTYCDTIRQHCENLGRSVHVVNLDPAAENFNYPCSIDISELVTVTDVMDELEYGPNGGLMYCMEYLASNLDWLQEKLGDYEEDYLIVDCPGQIELYTHSSVMKRIVEFLHREMGYKMVTLYLLDSNFVGDSSKFVAGTLMCLASMVNFEMPHINILTKVDLLGKAAYTADFDKFLEVNVPVLLSEDTQNASNKSSRFSALSEAIGELLDQWSLVNFVPLDVSNEESISDLLAHIDNATQYGENEEPKEPEEDFGDEGF